MILNIGMHEIITIIKIWITPKNSLVLTCKFSLLPVPTLLLPPGKH